ncbi:DUF5959 family protein [Streptomyces scabiei]|uniref:DUF5959 family protein n=1 Tax=Streptomyces scabiei TaxID=1930 RepID=UPI0036B57615
MPGVLPLHDLLDAVCWTDDDRSPEIKGQALDEEHGPAAVHVEDATGSGRSVLLALCLEQGWTSDQRRLLEQVRREWPSEVRPRSDPTASKVIS